MKRLTAIALAVLFTASAGLALADGTGGACNGKKCSGHHWHKKGSKHAKDSKQPTVDSSQVKPTTP